MSNTPLTDLSRLKRKLAAVFFTVATFVVAASLLFNINFRASRKASAEQLLRSIEDIKLGELLRWRQERISDARSLIDSPILGIYLQRLAADHSDKATAALLEKRLQFFLRNNKYPFVALADGGGRVLVSAGSRPEALCPQFKALIPRALASGRPEMGDFYRSDEDGAPHIDIIAPAVKTAKGRELLLLLRVDPAESLYPMLQTWSARGETGEVLLVAQSGEDVLFLNDLRHVKDAALKLRIPLATEALPAALGLKGFSGLVRGMDYRGVDVLAAVGPVPGSNWALVTKMDWAEVMAGTGTVGGLLLLVVLGLLAAAAGWTFVIIRGHTADFMRGVMDNLPVGIAVNSTSPSVKFEYMNDLFPVYYRTTRERLRAADSFWEAVYEDPAAREEIKKRVLDDCASGDPARMVWNNIPIARKDGGVRYVDAQNIPLPGQDLMISVVIDVTARRRSELEILALNADLVEKTREMENFLYITSHDLRSPLVNIQGFSQNLAEYLEAIKEGFEPRPGGAGQQAARLLEVKLPAALGFITESAAKMDRLITALLRLSRLGRAPVRAQTVDMNALLRQITSYFSFQAEKAGAVINCGDLPPCTADKESLNQIFSNLLENALKYRHPGRPPAIEVSGRLEGGRAVYELRDNGLGIEASQKDKIWQLFYRIDPAAGQDGEGVGLSLVKTLAAKNGGSVSVTSEPGQWSAFRLEFPAAQEEKWKK